MRIRSQLLAIVIGSLALAAAATLAVFAAARHEDAARDAQSRAQVTAHEVAGLLTLTQEYARYAEPRAAQQWHERHGAISAALKDVAHESLDGAALTELRGVAEALPALFSRLESIPADGQEFTLRRKEALLDQLLTNTQALSDDAYQWFQDAAMVRREAELQFQWIAFSTPCVMLLMLIATAWLLRQRVLLPMARLKQAAAAVQRGELDFRLGSGRADEIGDLSRQFDTMTQALAEGRSLIEDSRKRLLAVTNNLPVLIGYVDAAEVYRFTNVHYKAYFGVEPESFIGTTMAQSLGAAAYGALKHHIDGALRGERQQFERRGLGLRGETHVLVDYVPDADGGFLIMVADITARKTAELKQAASERRLADIANSLPALVGYINRNRCYEFANRRYRDWLGLDPAGMIGREFTDVMGSTSYSVARNNVERALAGEHVQWTGRVGNAHWMAEYIPDVAPDGTVRGCYALTLDVTERREAELRIAASEQRLLDLMNNIPALVGYFDMDERCQFANDTGLNSLGVERSEVPGVTMRGALGETIYAQHEPYVKEALKGRRARLEGSTPFRERQAHFQAHLIPDHADGGAQRGFYLMTFDITALKEAQSRQEAVERQLSLLVRSDTLTGLANRYQFNETLPQALARARRSGDAMALMFLDIDHFKSINDTLGHAAGDAVLREFAARLERSVRSTDAVARLAGDEFVIILEGLHGDAEPRLVANKIIDNVNLPLLVEGRTLSVTTSVGIVYVDASADAATPSGLLAQADEALYAAKAAGRNTFRFSTATASLECAHS